MSALTPEVVERIALLARLALTEEEKSLFAHQLSAVLDHATALEAIDVSNVPPTATVLPIRSVVREQDAVYGSIARKDALKNAPRTDGKSFIVPATLGDAE